MNRKVNTVVYFRRRPDGRRNYGLDLETQKIDVQRFVETENLRVRAEFIEIENGKMGSERPALEQAISTLRGGELLLIASNYRVAVNNALLHRLRDVNFAVANDKTISSETVQAVLDRAAEWARRQSEIVREKMKGGVYGAARKNAWKDPSSQEAGRVKATQASSQARSERARAAYAAILPVMKELQKKQGLSLSQIAKRLNEDGYMTSTGGSFSAQTVHKILKRD